MFRNDTSGHGDGTFRQLAVMAGATTIGTGVFAALAIACHFLDADLVPMLRYVLTSFGAIVLSFCGGVHWGVALQRAITPPFIAALPVVAGWGAALVGGRYGLWGLTAAFTAFFLFECVSMCRGTLPPWYLNLRLHATTIAIISLIAATL